MPVQGRAGVERRRRLHGERAAWVPVERGAAGQIQRLVELAAGEIADERQVDLGAAIRIGDRQHALGAARLVPVQGRGAAIGETRQVDLAAALPVVSYLGPASAGIITGSVVVEQIFSIPGIGRYFVQGALNRDYTLVMGVVIFYGVLIILFNLIVDVLYGVLDPKLRQA